MEVAQVQYNLKKYLTVTTLTVALVAAIFIGAYSIFSTRSQLKLVQSELAAANLRYGIVEKEKARLDSLATFYIKSIGIRDTALAIKQREIDSKSKEIYLLRHKLADALIDVSKLRADSSYAYINRRIPATSELKYPFDSTQVKQIHYTFVERDGLQGMNIAMDSLIANLTHISYSKDSQMNELRSLNEVYLSQNEICKSENDSYKGEVKALTKENKHQRVFKNISNGAVIGLIIVILIGVL